MVQEDALRMELLNSPNHSEFRADFLCDFFYVIFEIHIKIQIHKNSVFVVFPKKYGENMICMNLGRYVNFKIHIKN